MILKPLLNWKLEASSMEIPKRGQHPYQFATNLTAKYKCTISFKLHRYSIIRVVIEQIFWMITGEYSSQTWVQSRHCFWKLVSK